MQRRALLVTGLFACLAPAASADIPPPHGGGGNTAMIDLGPEPPPTEQRRLTRPEWHGGILWPAGTYIVVTKADGKLQSAVTMALPEAATIHGVTWPAGSNLYWSPDTGLSGSRVLSGPETIEGVAWPTLTVLGFDAKGRVRNATVRFAFAAGFGGPTWQPGSELQCDSSGKVLSAMRRLGEATEVEGVRWEGGTLLFFEPTSGAIKSASISFMSGGRYGGIDWPEGTSIELDTRGRRVRAQAFMPAGSSYRGRDFGGPTNVELDPGTGAIISAESYWDRVDVGR